MAAPVGDLLWDWPPPFPRKSSLSEERIRPEAGASAVPFLRGCGRTPHPLKECRDAPHSLDRPPCRRGLLAAFRCVLVPARAGERWSLRPARLRAAGSASGPCRGLPRRLPRKSSRVGRASDGTMLPPRGSHSGLPRRSHTPIPRACRSVRRKRRLGLSGTCRPSPARLELFVRPALGRHRRPPRLTSMGIWPDASSSVYSSSPTHEFDGRVGNPASGEADHKADGPAGFPPAFRQGLAAQRHGTKHRARKDPTSCHHPVSSGRGCFPCLGIAVSCP